MSQLDSNLAGPPRGVLVKKPKTNIYTVMLILAFVFMLLGCLFLGLEWNRTKQAHSGVTAPAATASAVAPDAVAALMA